jgi:hypothetical protein
MAVLPTGIGPVTGGYQIERSLRFNSADSAYLNRTPSGAGNRRTFTLNFWAKLTGTGLGFFIAATGASGNNMTSLYWRGLSGTAKIEFEHFNGTTYNLTTDAVFRDPSAWYMITVVVDTTQATAANRTKIYVNNVQQTVTGSYVPQNTDLFINNNTEHDIGASINANAGRGNYFNGYPTEINFIDGQALTPSSFGETDSNTGVWKPKAYTGTYGTNGFYLPFKTASQWSGLFDGTGDYLTFPTSANTNLGAIANAQMTYEFWINTTNIQAITAWKSEIFGNFTSTASNGRYLIYTEGTSATSSQKVAFQYTTGTSSLTNVTTTATMNQKTWNHVAITVDATTPSSSTIKIFINGVGQTFTGQNLSTHTTSPSVSFALGFGQDGFQAHSGYLSNFRVVRGSLVYTSDFTPPTSQLTAISGTVLLTCQSSTFIDNSSNAYSITTNGNAITQQFSPFTLDVTDDHSGQGNNWIPNNLDLRTTGVGADILVDSPTAYGTDAGVGGTVRGNYCTLNPVNATSAAGTSLSNGNLQINGIGSGNVNAWIGTLGVSSGKWYYEVIMGENNGVVGISQTGNPNQYPGGDATSYGYSTATKYNNNTGTSYGATLTGGDVVGCAYDLDAGTITFYKNGVSQGQAFSGLSGIYFPAVRAGSTGAAVSVNFGQRAFAYTAPSGFKALCTTNLPTPTITNGAAYMAATTYTGTGATQSISNAVNGVSMQPDWVWFKRRGAVENHWLTDSVRGSTKGLFSNLTDAEATRTDQLTSFNSNGFSLGADAAGYSNANGNSYVAWQWNAGGSNATNTAGTITSTVRANTTSGFSIVTYTGTGANATVGHGLGVAPSMIILKGRTNADQWFIWHNTFTSSQYIYFNTTAIVSGANPWNSTLPTSTLFSLGTDAGVNGNTTTYVAYCFSEVAGYSRFGSYTGNGSADGPFVYTNHRPAFVLLKRTDSTSNWTILDFQREGYNVDNDPLFPNLSNAEGTTDLADILSNGFKLRSTDASVNASGGTYIYMSVASNPFKYSLGR